MIGIVGGVGPFAGLDVFRKITEETKAVRDQDHVPVLMFSLPGEIPDRTAYLTGKEQINPAYALSRIILDLEKAGATVAGIPCNTAHALPIFNVIKKELKNSKSQILLLNMIEEVVKTLQREQTGKKIGILCTTGTKKAGIYRQSLSDAEFGVIEPGDEWQERIHTATYSEEYGIKANSSPVTSKARKELELAVKNLEEKGAEVIILGCTEIPLALPEKKLNYIPLIDPNRVLAQALLSHYSKI